MNEGKELLLNIIDNQLKLLSSLNTDVIFIDNINLVELDKLLDNDDNFFMLTDNLIDKLVKSEKNKKDIMKLRDLFVGKKDYKLNVTLTKEYISIIDKFKKSLKDYLNKIDSNILNKNDKLNRINDLKRRIESNYIINDTDIIEDIVKSYDELAYDKNMLVIMQYINDHNIEILKKEIVNPPVFDVNIKKRIKLDANKKEILKYLNIDEGYIPKYMLYEFKMYPFEDMNDIFKVIKKNKAEDGGISHFFEEDATFAKLCILMYSTEDTIINVINSIKENGVLDINLLKNIIKYIPSVFISKENNYIIPKYDDFIKNIEYLRKLKVNYRTLIEKNPLFMLINHDTLIFTLNYLEKYGANKKNVINRCYKILAIKPSVLIENIEVMRLHNINLEKFFSKENVNYNLLKMSDLDKKLRYLESRSELLNKDELDFELVNKMIISKVYGDSKIGAVVWGE